MAEFALIAPVFMLIVAGLLAFGRVFFYWIEANHLANETARWAAVDRNPYAPTKLQVAAADGATTEFKSDVKVCIDFPGETFTSVEQGDSVRVMVQKPFNFIPFLEMTQITIHGESTMRVERLGDNVNPTSYSDADNVNGPCA